MSNQELMAQAPEASLQLDAETLEKLVVAGDLSKLTTTQRLHYYRARCEAAGLDYRTSPFKYLSLQGRLVLYADKVASDQLQAIHGAQVKILNRETVGDIHAVLVAVHLRDGRSTEDEGCVSVKGLSGDALCNARLKAVTKAKRRAILSICGLGMLDETEIETIPQARAWSEPPRTLDALVAQTQPKEPPAPAAATDAPVALRKASGLTIDLSQPWDDFKGETIGGGNRNIQALRWEDLVASQDPGVLAAVRKGLDAAIAKENATGQPVEARYQKLALAWEAREQVELHAPASEAL